MSCFTASEGTWRQSCSLKLFLCKNSCITRCLTGRRLLIWNFPASLPVGSLFSLFLVGFPRLSPPVQRHIWLTGDSKLSVDINGSMDRALWPLDCLFPLFMDAFIDSFLPEPELMIISFLQVYCVIRGCNVLCCSKYLLLVPNNKPVWRLVLIL